MADNKVDEALQMLEDYPRGSEHYNAAFDYISEWIHAAGTKTARPPLVPVPPTELECGCQLRPYKCCCQNCPWNGNHE